MSSFAPSSFKNFKLSTEIPITSKVSQKDRRKGQKQNNKKSSDSKLNILSDKEL